MVLAQASGSGLSIGDLLWIIILLSAFQPALRRYLLTARRLQMIRRIERVRGTRVIALIHRQETMSLLGFPILRYLDIQDSEEVLRAIRLTPPDMPIDIILHTPGGLVLASSQIAEALRHHPGRVTALVPHYAMSGGTLIALAADEIVMASSAVLDQWIHSLASVPRHRSWSSWTASQRPGSTIARSSSRMSPPRRSARWTRRCSTSCSPRE